MRRSLFLFLMAGICIPGSASEIFLNECNTDDCPPVTPLVAPGRFTVVEPLDGPQCTFAQDGVPPAGCKEMSMPMAWNHSPYDINLFAKRAIIVVHGTGSDAINAAAAVQYSSNQLGLPEFETLIFAPQFTEEDGTYSDDVINIDSICIFEMCADGVNDGEPCTTHDDCVDTNLPYFPGDWRYGFRSKSGGSFGRPFRISSFEVVDQLIRQIAHRFPSVQQIVVAGHSAGGQYVSRYAAFTTVPAEVNLPLRIVSSGPSRLLYFDNRRKSPLSDPPAFGVPVFDCNCPAYSDLELTGYNDYPYGLEIRDQVDFGNNPYLYTPTDDELRNRYASYEVAHIVGERDTCPYSSGGTCSAQGCQICIDPCAVQYCNKNCNGGQPGCALAIQGGDHIDTIFTYRDYASLFFGPEIFAKHRFELIPCIGHSTCCSWQSQKGKKYLFDVKNIIDGFDWNPGPLDNGWLNSPDNQNGNLVNVAGELVPDSTGSIVGAYRPVPIGDGLRIRALLRETDPPDLSGSRFEHFMMLYSHGDRSSGYGIGVERSGAATSDSRITLYENGRLMETASSTFQFQQEVEVEFAVLSDGRIQGTAIEGDQEFAFAFAARPIPSSGINFLYHTAWSAPGASTPPRLDYLTIHEISSPVATPPGGSRFMKVDKLDSGGNTLSVEWETRCPSAAGYHLVYGGGSQLPSAAGAPIQLLGSECGINAGSPYTWIGSPSTSIDPGGLVWWLMLANDGAATEGSWGLDGEGNERVGPAVGGASGQCGIATLDPANPCGR